jgi:CRP/FNR family cyclic AMP-dependent transcriptional regulator
MIAMVNGSLEDFWHLHGFNWPSELSAAETERLRRESVQREYDAGVSPTRAETTFGYVSPGEIFGEVAAFSSRPRESHAKAVRASLVWQLRREAIRAVLALDMGAVLAITKQVGSRLKRIESRVEHLVFRSVPCRVAAILLELAEDFGRREADGLVIDLAISQEELATLIGASRQAVNASLRELQHEGVIGREGRRLVLLDIDALRRSRDSGEHA